MLQFTTQEKQQISDSLMKLYESGNFESMSKFATSVDLLPADMTNISKNKWQLEPHLIGDSKWIKIARIVKFDRRQIATWKVAETATFKYTVGQLTMTQEDSMANMLVDDSGLGKTVAAEWYAKNRKYAFNIDCCANPNKALFIRAIAQAVGVGRYGKLNDLIEDTIYALRQMDNPLLILDEAGDLEHPSILILKRFYNALKGVCGFYLIGADGMKKKIKNGIANEKLGFIEVFSRYGRNFKKATPDLMDEKKVYYQEQAVQIALVNGLSTEEANQVAKMLTKNGQLNDMRWVENAVKGFLKRKKK
jgi:hypothetical protein